MERLATGFVEHFTRPFHFDFVSSQEYMKDIMWTTFWISMAYVVLIFSLKFIMTNFKPFQLTSLLNFWNAWLAIFSTAGAVVVGYGLAKDVWNYGLDRTFCEITPVWHGVSGYFSWVFAMSKIAEFGDTILIVLRKKPLIFLHWYHHVFTMNYAIMSFVEQQGFNSWIVWLNLTVHAIMYSYYMVRSMGIRVPASVAQMITMSQIAQFLITLGMLARTGYLQYAGNSCKISPQVWSWCLFMEISYVILFGNFFYQSYVKGGGKKFNAEKGKKVE